MSFCCTVESHFDRQRAERDLVAYRRRGLRGAPRVTRLLIAELTRYPLSQKHLLDIGSGIAVVSAELSTRDIASATIVEASPAFLEIAQRELKPRYGSRPIQFFRGDFTQIENAVPTTDITILDRVVCCYPDPDALLAAAASHTREILAISYPKDRWFVLLVVAYENFMRRRKGNLFQTFVHSPQQMASVLGRAGFVRTSSRGTLGWRVELFHRLPAG
jgi:magnesium-protoporphyrin O-methyltransferase